MNPVDEPGPERRKTALLLRNLRIYVSGATIVDRLTLSMSSGDLVFLTGPSGCGKTSVIRALTGLLPACFSVEGEMLLGQRPLHALKPPDWAMIRGAQIGMVFQSPASAFNPLRRCGAQIADAVTFHGRTSSQSLIAEALAEAGFLDPDRIAQAYPSELSGGQLQRVMIAGATLLRPAFLVADEPTTALDPMAERTVLEVIQNMRLRYGMGIILVTHDTRIIDETAGRVIRFQKGETPENQPQFMVRPRPTPKRQTWSDAPALSIQDLSVSVGRDQQVLRNIKLTVRRGEIVGVVGPSGSGKTSLARCIVGTRTPTRGSVSVLGCRAPTALQDRGRHVQLINQDPFSSLDPLRTIGSSIGEALRNRVLQQNLAEQVAELLDAVDLPRSLAGRRPAELSGGQCQRVCIARALARDPEIIVGDEPLASLDAETKDRILGLFREIRDQLGTAILLISHDFQAVSQISDRLVVLDNGEIIESGSVSETLEHPVHPTTRAMVATLREPMPWNRAAPRGQSNQSVTPLR